MPFDDVRRIPATGARQAAPQHRFRPAGPPGDRGARSPARSVTGTPAQRHARWIERAEAAERGGDRIEAELCRQHAEHFFRVMNGRD
jgi:hypothetical protein